MDNIWNGVVTPVAGNGANSNISLFPWADQPTQTESTPQTQVKRWFMQGRVRRDLDICRKGQQQSSHWLRCAYGSATWGAAQVIWARSSFSLRAEPNKDGRLVSGKLGAETKCNGTFLFLQSLQASECQQSAQQSPAALAFNSIVLKCQTGSLPLA